MKKMVIVIAPSGGGKSTFLEKILAERKELESTVTYTTRPMRKGESEGHPYHFVSMEKFKELREQGFFVEWAEVHGKLYGTPGHQIDDIWKKGKHVIMDVDVQGAFSLCKKYPKAFTLFILPPSIDELRRRVIAREGKEPADLELRMSNAEKEIALAERFDARLVNDQFDASYARFKKMIEDYLNSP